MASAMAKKPDKLPKISAAIIFFFYFIKLMQCFSGLPRLIHKLVLPSSEEVVLTLQDLPIFSSFFLFTGKTIPWPSCRRLVQAFPQACAARSGINPDALTGNTIALFLVPAQDKPGPGMVTSPLFANFPSCFA
ncbi:MAG: hypothetical protein KUL80_02660 [Comamonas sp.]|nr:hypothetical protein [Comamonas sp.]